MNAITQEFRTAGRRLAATPAAMFVAVLTAGFAIASTANHMGLYNAGASRLSGVVLACPRTSAAKSAAAAHKTAQASPAAAPHAAAGSSASAAVPQSGTNLPSEKQSAGKTGGGLSVPLPDFNAPELSRFISPL